jgi:maleylacetate reductase
MVCCYPLRVGGAKKGRSKPLGEGLVFEHETLGQRVLFGAGRASRFLSEEVQRRGAGRVMVIASDRERERNGAVLEGLDTAFVFGNVAQHVPVETAENARQQATEHGIDLLVSLGGGSATGLAKAVALTSGLPIVAVPTTYAGSEATDVWGLTENGRKTTGADRRVLPETVVYDAQLMVSLPPELGIASGLNALAHCVDSLWAPRADPINAALATEGIRALARGLPAVKAAPQELPGREDTLYGAYLAAVAFASAGSGMHHKICHVLGGRFGLPHAQMHAVVLPHVLAFNAAAAGGAAERIAAAFGTGNAMEGLEDLRSAVDAPQALKDYGLAESDLQEAVELILPYIPESNPRAVDAGSLARLLRDAWAGERPAG